MTCRAPRSLMWLAGVSAAVLAAIAAALLIDLPMEGRQEILWRIRVPRVCLGLAAGAALAASGMAFQAMFRNALATPYTLGVSSGASLGAALYMRAALRLDAAGIDGVSLAALAGAVLSTMLVYGLTRLSRAFSTATLLLAGVATSFSFTSLILLTQYTSDVTTAFRVGRWLMGGLEVVGFEPVWQVLPFATVGLIVVTVLTREMDLLVVGEDLAATRGVSVEHVKRLLFFAVSLMVGGVTAVCGPIGFVGLIVPHIGRLLVGGHHRFLAPFSILGGATFLVTCDTVARVAIAPVEVPVGSITALVGGPFFLTLLLWGRANRGFETS
ncbi:MAG TPA: iron ABC transporter permease [Vicinamibacterales bacterium]|nr:iron ABC transporter permease [Vicinamibacterales bacterium]